MKRKRTSNATARSEKRRKFEQDVSPRSPNPLLAKYYPRLLTLREYLSSQLSGASRSRQRTIALYGKDASIKHDESVVDLLDSVTVGIIKGVHEVDSWMIDRDMNVFTQQVNASPQNNTLTPGRFKQTEIIDFVIWLLFRRCSVGQKPRHIFCQGFQKTTKSPMAGAEPFIEPGIPGVLSTWPNDQVMVMKSHPWSVLPDLLGKGSEAILSKLFLDCGIYSILPSGDSLIQLCGMPLSDLDIIPYSSSDGTIGLSTKPDSPKEEQNTARGFAAIRFMRHRMLYSRPDMNIKGKILFGLPKIHALNRTTTRCTGQEVSHLIKYIFPAQFGLHNVLRSTTDPRETAQRQKDYTLREQEIARCCQLQFEKRKKAQPAIAAYVNPIPRRLRGKATKLVRCIWKRHLRCSYPAILNHYCPRNWRETAESSLQHATSVSQVSAFCRAVIWKIFPKDLWGVGDVRSHNVRKILHNIDRFIHLRRFESITLHDMMHGIKLVEIDWLVGPKMDRKAKMSMTDFTKRKELMAELLYYLIDSFLIPLIRGHFHVTESNANRNQIFYFRHDVWKDISEPSLMSLKTGMLQEFKGSSAKQLLARRALGVSNIRFLPKEFGMRPIINLRRRVQKLRSGNTILGRSINSVLTPAFSVLNYEKASRPEALGSALFSVDDIFPRLQHFRTSLHKLGLAGKRLYFAKVDVQACFDTIPQERLLQVVRKIIVNKQYQVSRFAKARMIGRHDHSMPGFGSKPSWRFLTKATVASKSFDVNQEAESDSALGRRRMVYVNGIPQKPETRQGIITLLEEHIACNILKIGKRFYRQKEGIPQGSIVSSLLCSYFYAELEKEILGFINDSGSILLRLIDDFLVISVNKDVAERFIRTMHRGAPEFGVRVKVEKSLANFDIDIDGKRISRIPNVANFPYCGNAINTVTMDLSKDLQRRRRINIADSLTVEFSNIPGQSFYRKTLKSVLTQDKPEEYVADDGPFSAMKLHMNAMHISTSYNCIETVFVNLYHNFTEVALKSFHYSRTLEKRPSGKLNIRVVEDVIRLACVLLRRLKRTSKDIVPYECAVSKDQAEWLACTAFSTVFGRRQTKHVELLEWLQWRLNTPALRTQRRLLGPIIREYKSRTRG